MTDVRRRALRCGLLTALVLGAALGAPGCSSSRTAPSATPAPEATSTQTPVPSATTPAPSPVPLAEATREWTRRAGDHFTASGKALQEVSEASASGDEAGLRDGCTQLHDTNTIGLQRDLPTPDPRLTDELQRMIDDINTATHACVRFVLARDAVDSATYQDYLARAVEHLHRAKGFLNEDLAPK
jgi:hypothetical protein